MIVRSSHIITLPSGNLARDFRWESLGFGRVRVQYNYTDRRRAHQVARKFTVEFLNGKVETIQARSANGGRVEFFKSSAILDELLEMLAEFNEVVNGVAARNEPAKVEAVEQDSVSVEDDTASSTSTDLKDTVELLRGVVISTSPWCLKLLGNLDEVKDDADKGFCLAVLNGLDIDDKFREYFDFEAYWNDKGGDTITTSYGVYMVDVKGLAYWLKELAAY